MPTVSRLSELRDGRVAVDLDGRRWRTLPADVVVRAAIREGDELDRARLRTLARELRRARAVDRALRAVARRDHSSDSLRRRVRGRGVRAADVEEAVGRLERAGVVDDERFAARRAAALAKRELGDEAIRWRLRNDGVSDEHAVEAVAMLEPELERARAVVRVRGAGPSTARALARRGFGDAAVEEALGPAVADSG